MTLSQLYGSVMFVLISFNEPTKPLSCGQASCYLLLARLQMPVTMQDLDQDFAELRTEASFHELQSVLQKHGLPTIPWKLDWEDFQPIRGPFIAHVNDPKTQFRHYHLAEWKGSELVIVDPLATKPLPVGTASRLEAYRKTISGNVLVPSIGVPRAWHWRGHLKFGSIIVVVGMWTFWLLLHQRAAKRGSMKVADRQL